MRLLAATLLAFALSAAPLSAASAAPSSTPGSVSATPIPSGASGSSGSSANAAGSTAGRATFGIGPANSGSAGRPYFSYEMGVNGLYRDTAMVVNFASRPIVLSIFATDLGNGANGSIAVGLQTQQTKDAGGWIHMSPKQRTLTVPARRATGPGVVLVPFTIRVPSQATPGDHGAALVAVLSTLGKNAKGENVRLDQRIAVRIYLRINGPLLPELTIENLHASYHGVVNPFGAGKATVTYTVHNTGNVRLAARQAVQVTGMFGAKSAVVSPPNVQLLFPGGSENVVVTVSGVRPAIFAKARVTVTPLLFADQPQMRLDKVSAVTTFRAMPWSPLACLGALVLLVVGVLASRRLLLRRRRPSRHGPPAGGSRGPKGPRQPRDPQPDSSITPAGPERVHS